MSLAQNNKDVIEIRETNFTRAHFIGTAEEIKNAYLAYFKFYKILTSDEFSIKMRMNDGEMIAFNNTRILHGRLEFSSNENRLLQGAYFDWDMLLSQYRTYLI